MQKSGHHSSDNQNNQNNQNIEEQEKEQKNQQHQEENQNNESGRYNQQNQAQNQNRYSQEGQKEEESVHNSPSIKQSHLSQSKSHQSKNIGSIKHKKKTLPSKENELWKAYDFLFPGGKLSKLIKVSNVYKKNLPINEMLTKFKYNDAYPVINLIGGMENNRGKFYAGVARAAFNTDAVIVTNGIATGLQKFVLRRGVKTIGIAPQKQVKFPKINPTFVQKMELANGHTHLFLLNNPERDLSWGGEVEFKINIALRLAEGKKKGQPNCKIVSLLVGDALFDELQEVKKSVQNDFPIIVVPGSPLCDQLIKNSTDPKNSSYSNQQMRNLVEKGHFFYCNTTNSEDVAQLVHLLLVIRPW